MNCARVENIETDPGRIVICELVTLCGYFEFTTARNLTNLPRSGGNNWQLMKSWALSDLRLYTAYY